MPRRLAAPDARRRLPAVDRVLDDPRVAALVAVYGRDAVIVQARAELAALRERLAARGGDAAGELAALPEAIAGAVVRRLGAPPRRVLNATGVFLHTNLGRAPLPPEVAATLPRLLDAACDLELDLVANRRGDRLTRLAALVETISGAEAALAVNNNAAALVLVLAALAAGREVVVSRGELVEIGDSFRIPEILAAAGSRLVEVGTTNRTHLADYERALGPETALVLKVHASNYRLRGFVAAVEVEPLAALARERGLPLLVDEGAGLLAPHPASQLAGHPSFRALLAAGADLVCGSGDKLLGGPQAGLLAGRRELVARCRRHPLYRALRLGRGAAVTLDAVLRRHLAGLPLPLARLWPDAGEHRARLARAAAACGAEIVAAEAFVGGGAAPDAAIPGEALALPGDEGLAARLRAGDPPVVGYLRAGRLVLDLRTVDPSDDAALVAAVAAARG
jgi:L-seryl-tRNA(Ser) seleniumtransferase